MTAIPAFERDPYLKRLDVEILEIGENGGRPWAIVDDTLLYPEGGGQPADHGRLGPVAVVDVQKVGSDIRHYLETGCDAGPALLELDWPRRYDHMQQHSAQHLLSALALGRFGWATRSFHLGPETSDIELDVAEPARDEIASLEDAAAAEIRAGRLISTRRVPAEECARLGVRSRGLPADHIGDVRLVEIEDVDLNTCGGTHLRSTSEIEAVKIVRTERLRGGTRFHWVAGARVRRRLAAHEARNAELRSLLDSDDQGLPQIAALKLDQLAEARRRNRFLERQLAEVRVDGLAASTDTIVAAHFDQADGGFLRQVAGALAERAPIKTFLLTASGEKGAFFLVGAGRQSSLDASRLGPLVAEMLEGRGGGSGAVFQGKAGSLDRRAEAESILLEAVKRGD